MINSKVSITITKQAAKKILKIKKKNKKKGLRLSTKLSGCAGMSYSIEFTNTIKKNDLILKEKGIKIIIEKKNIPYFNGIELDFVKEQNPHTGLYKGFKFKNPNTKNQCGCGKSFKI